MDRIRIDQLNSTLNPSLDHEFPAVLDGVTVRLSVNQVRVLIAATLGLLSTLDSVEEVPFDGSASTFDFVNTLLGAALRELGDDVARIDDDLAAAEEDIDDLQEEVSVLQTLIGGALPAKQTVLTGPRNAGGRADFLTKTGSLQVSLSGTILATAGMGLGAGGAINVTRELSGIVWNVSDQDNTRVLFVNLDTLYVNDSELDLNPATGRGPFYEYTQPATTASNAIWYNIGENQVYRYDSGLSQWVPEPWVAVGEVTKTGGGAEIDAAISYAYQGYFESDWQTGWNANNTQYFSVTDNLGIPMHRKAHRTLMRIAAGNVPSGREVGQVVDLNASNLSVESNSGSGDHLLAIFAGSHRRTDFGFTRRNTDLRLPPTSGNDGQNAWNADIRIVVTRGF